MLNVIEVKHINSKTRGDFVLGEHGVDLIEECQKLNYGYFYNIHQSGKITQIFDATWAGLGKRDF